MKKVIDGFVEKSETLLYGLGILAILLVLGVRFFLLNRGLIPSDEGWYFILLRDLPTDTSQRFHLLFHNVFQNNVYLIRLVCYCIMLIASIVFALGLKMYFEKVLNKHLPYLFCLGVLFLGQMFVIDCSSIYYVNLNVSIMELSLGFMLIGLAKRSCAMQILTGFTMSFLFPVMITNVMIIPLTLVALFLLSSDRWKDVCMFILGVVLFFAYYFVFVESPSEILGYVQANTSNVVSRGSGEYGLLFYVDWLYHTSIYFIRLAIIAFVIVMIPVSTKNIKWGNQTVKVIINFILVFVAAYYFYKYTKPCIHFNNWWAYDIYGIAFFVLLISGKFDLKKMYPLILLLLVTPICLSFGSNCEFESRQIEYLVFVTPLVFLLASTSKKEKSVLFVSFLFVMAVFVNSLFGFNWHMDYYLKQDVAVSTIGIKQNVRLERKYIDELAFVKEHVDEGESCLVDNEFWYVADLLELKPIYYGFRLPDIPEIEQMIEKSTSNGDVLNVIYKDSRFGFVFNDMVDNPGYCVQKVEDGDNIVMKIKKAEQ